MLTLAAAARALGATVAGPDTRFESVSTDSRTLERGALFVALRGERFDGHEYVGAARDRGAAAALVERGAQEAARAAGLPLIVVEDARVALGALAGHWRGRFRIPVVGVVGSNGKTTVKEMAAACLREQYGAARVLATAGNLNNDIGLPLTCLRLRGAHACAVLEIGMNHPGETARLAHIARPTIALVNNAQREHQEFMQGVDEVAAEHGALVRALPADGVAVLNRDDAHFEYWRGLAGARRVRDFGLGGGAAVHARVRASGAATEFELETDAGGATVRLHAPGLHNVRNALAAIAVATELEVADADIQRALAGFAGIGRRLEVIGDIATRAGRVTLVDDYGHHPTEIEATIEAARQAWPGRRLVLAFQPHRYTRTHDLIDDFGRALSAADALLVTEVYAAGEPAIANADGRAICRAVRGRGRLEPVFVEDVRELGTALAGVIADRDVVLTMGAGSIGAVAHELPGRLGVTSARAGR